MKTDQRRQLGESQFQKLRLIVLFLAGVAYLTELHLHGYGGDPNQFLELAEANDWTTRTEHFGYISTLTLVLRVLGPVVRNDYVVQGLVSVAAALVAVLAVIELAHGFTGNRLTGLLSGAVFAFSGQVMMTATYGETYALQIAVIAAAAVAGMKRKLFWTGLLAIFSLALTPLSLLLMPLVAAAYVQSGKPVIPRPREVINLTVGLTLGAAIVLLAGFTHGTSFWMPYFDYVTSPSSSTFASARSSLLNLAYPVVWFMRGFNLLVPFVVAGALLTLVKGPRSLFLIWAAIVALNWPFLLRIDDYWRTLGLLSVPYSMWAGVAMAAIFHRWPRPATIWRAGAAAILIGFFVFNRFDGVSRESAVASENSEIAKYVANHLHSGVIVLEWEMLVSLEHYQPQAVDSGAGTGVTLSSAPPIENWSFTDPEWRMINERLDNGQPVYVFVRSERYDSPIMRLALREALETHYLTAYKTIFRGMNLTEVGRAGGFHTVYQVTRATP